MPFTYPIFDLRVERNVHPERLSWPEPGEAMDEMSLVCNRFYTDLRRLSWKEARRVYALEEKYIERIEDLSQSNVEREAIEAELEDAYFSGLYGLDLGVASTVVSLSAARCVPFASCNAGAFGGVHFESYPLVAFYIREEMTTLLLECSEESNTGLNEAADGCVVVYANIFGCRNPTERDLSPATIAEEKETHNPVFPESQNTDEVEF